MLALAAVALALGRRDEPVRQRVALCLAAIATLLQAGHGHAASMFAGPRLLLAAGGLHLLAAGTWLGGLLPLLLLVRDATPRAGAIAARWFSPLGKLCIAGLVVSAGFQGWVLAGSIPRLLGTAYGWMILVKLALFGVLLAFAAVNRYRIAPALLRDQPVAAKRWLVRSIAVQTGFGIATIAAAAMLSSLPPAMHVQPYWPFADRLTLDTVQEDPDFRRELIGAVSILAGSALLLIAALLWRGRLAWLAVAAAVAAAWSAAPHLDLLLVPAYPTSYYSSPTGFAASAIVQGAALYPSHCAACHGAEGHGDGPAAAGLPVPPADLTADHLWMHSDGELFWWLTHGIEAPLGGLAMPGFAATLSEEERWDLIDYVRAHNAGLAFARSKDAPPVAAPGFEASCGDGQTRSPMDFPGRFMRLVFGGTAAPARLVAAWPEAASEVCGSDDQLLPEAYAIVSGTPPERMPGTQFLIDGDGWLRAMQQAGAAPGWDDTKVLKLEIRQLDAHPVAPRAPLSMQMMR
jgi:mono/diheme cytochrome c family protein